MDSGSPEPVARRSTGRGAASRRIQPAICGGASGETRLRAEKLTRRAVLGVTVRVAARLSS